MSEHHDPGVDDGPDLVRNADAPLQLDGVGGGLLEEAARVQDGIRTGCLVGQKGHVADDERVGCRPAHGAGMLQAHVHGDREGVLETIDAHAQRITDQQHVHARGLGAGSRGRVVGGHPGSFFSATLHFV